MALERLTLSISAPPALGPEHDMGEGLKVGLATKVSQDTWEEVCRVLNVTARSAKTEGIQGARKTFIARRA